MNQLDEKVFLLAMWGEGVDQKLPQTEQTKLTINEAVGKVVDKCC